MLAPDFWLRASLAASIALGACSSCSDGSDPTSHGHSGVADAPPDSSTPRDDGGATRREDGSAPRDPLFAFVGSSDGKIRVYDVGDTGAWTLKKEADGGQTPSFLAFDPPRRRVVAVDEAAPSGLARSFSFDATTGALVPVNSKPAGGAGSTHVSLDPTGTWIFVANYTGGNMSVLPIDASGNIGDRADTKSSGNKSHWAGTNPSGTHVFVPALGVDRIAQYTREANGKLADNGTVSVPDGAGPRHLAFHPSERWAYAMNERKVSVTTFDFSKASGKLSPVQTIPALPAEQDASGVSGAEIFVHPGGRFVYGSTRVYNSIAVFRVAPESGTLTLLANAPTGANRPRSFGMDPEGTLLFAANQDAGEVVGFRIHGETGELTPLGKTVDVPSPMFVGLVRMPR